MYKQPDGISCGPSCIKMVSDYVNKENCDIEELMKVGNVDAKFGAIQYRMEKILKYKKLDYTLEKTLNIEELINGLNDNCVYIVMVYLEEIPHWILITKYEFNKFKINDPWLGETRLTDKQLIAYYKNKTVSKFSIGVSILVRNRVIKINPQSLDA